MKEDSKSQKDTNKGQTTANRVIFNESTGERRTITQADWRANREQYQAEGFKREGNEGDDE